MARQGRSNTTTYRIINICIVLTLTYSILCVAVFLRAKGAVCSTTSSGIDLSIAFSLPTIVILGVRCYMIFRQRSKTLQRISPSTVSPRLESSCAAVVQILVFVWMILAICLNLPVALRAPVCLDKPLPEWQTNLKEQNWRYGLACRLHRGLVALSVLMALFIASLSFLDSIDRQYNRRGTSLINCYCTCRKPPKNHAFAPSISSGRSGSSLGKEDPLHLIPERHEGRFDHEQWLQRRNSLSSQKAIFPHKYQWHEQRPRYAMYSLPHNSRYSSTLRSVSEGHSLELSNRNSSMTSSQSSNSWATTRSTRPSTLSSSRSRANSNPERGDLRRDTRGRSTTASGGIPDVPPLPILPPPAWSPALQHTPLSADPTIRALSTGANSRLSLSHSKSSPDLRVQPLNIRKSSAAEVASAKGEGSSPTTSISSASTKQAQTKNRESTSPRKPALPVPSIPPPAPPTVLAQPPPTATAVPAIPARAPGRSAATRTARAHTSTSTTTRSTSSTTNTSGSGLRRPEPIRYRQYQHHGLSLSQTQLPLQQYQHQRMWRHEHGSRNPSVYSASSYGTHASDRTTSMMARGSSAHTPSLQPVTAGR